MLIISDGATGIATDVESDGGFLHLEEMFLAQYGDKLADVGLKIPNAVTGCASTQARKRGKQHTSTQDFDDILLIVPFDIHTS